MRLFRGLFHELSQMSGIRLGRPFRPLGFHGGQNLTGFDDEIHVHRGVWIYPSGLRRTGCGRMVASVFLGEMWNIIDQALLGDIFKDGFIIIAQL